MKDNSYWAVAANGGVLPDAFHLRDWQEAFSYGHAQLLRAVSNFSVKPSWNLYGKLGGAIQRASCLLNLIQYIAPALPGINEEDRKIAYLKGSNSLQNELYIIKQKVEAFLRHESLSRDAFSAKKATYEQKYWAGISVKRHACAAMEQKLEREGGLVHFDDLSGIKAYPSLNKKSRELAKQLGLQGYVLDPTDTDTVSILNEEKSGDLRKNLWMSMQSSLPITPSETKKLIGLRGEMAKENGFGNYLGLISRFDRGLSFKTVEQQIVKSLSIYSADYKKARATETLFGAKQTKWDNKKDGDIRSPWNQSYLAWKFEEPTLGLSGQEFPLKRVLNVIVPDIMAMGGWTTSSISKVGRGKRCLYMYRFCKDGKAAILYLAPYPPRNSLSSDSHQAYATLLRERFTGGKNTTPMVFVASNLTLKKNALDDADQLSFLSHELAHVMHFFALEGKTFNEFDRIPANISELPSIMFERIASDCSLLQKWCNPAFKSGKKKDYWQRRKSKTSVHNQIEELEKAYIDIRAHRTSDPLLQNLHQNLREKTGMVSLHQKDKSAFCLFDRTDTAGLYSCYFIARALTSSILNNSCGADTISRETNFLIDHILSFNDKVEAKWKTAYGETMCSMFERGQKKLDQAFLRHVKAKDRSIKVKLKKMTNA